MPVKIKTGDILGVALLIPFLKPGLLGAVSPLLDKIFDISKIVSMLILILIFLAKRLTLDKMFFIVVAWCFSMILSSVCNDLRSIDWWTLIKTVAMLIATYLYIRVIFLYYGADYMKVLIPIEMLLIVNIISWILFPEGMASTHWFNGVLYSRKNWLLGTKNSYFPFLFFALVLLKLGIYRDNKKRGIHQAVLCLICIINILCISKSATGTIAILLMVVICYLDGFPLFRNKAGITALILGSFAICIAVVFLQIPWILEHVAKIMGKSSTFTGRTEIWSRTLLASAERPILGWGVEKLLIQTVLIGTTGAHNKILYVLFESGIVGLTLFAYVYLSVTKKVLQEVHRREARFIGLAFVALNIFWIAEGYHDFLISAFLIQGFYLPNRSFNPPKGEHAR